MSKTIALCGLGLVANNEACGEASAYRIEARTSDGRRVLLQLCSRHIHRAWHLAQALLEKKFPTDTPKVKSIHLRQIVKSVAAEAAS